MAQAGQQSLNYSRCQNEKQSRRGRPVIPQKQTAMRQSLSPDTKNLLCCSGFLQARQVLYVS